MKWVKRVRPSANRLFKQDEHVNMCQLTKRKQKTNPLLNLKMQLHTQKYNTVIFG